MPKHGFLTPKAIANRIKAKGLQKLKWYCQMCEKQCRDENGFKCHKLSESHQRKMKLFIAAPTKFMGQFSKEFDHGFMQILRLKGGRRVKANEVYQDYIANRQHIHMNATVWSTLSGYVMYLGKTGKAKVERAGPNEGNGKGWYITYIDRDPEVLSKQEQVKKLKKMEERERKMESQRIQKIIEQNQKMNKIKGNEYEVSGLQKETESEKITFGFRPKQSVEDEPDGMDHGDHPQSIMDAEDHHHSTKSMDERSNGTDCYRVNDIEESQCDETESTIRSKGSGNMKSDRKRKRTNLEELMEENEDRKLREKKRRRLKEESTQSIDSWLMKGIIVKIKDGEYSGKKGVVMDVVERRQKYRALLKLLKMENVEVEIKEKYLETVVPSFGRKVKILNGKYRNCIGTLQSIEAKRFRGEIQIRLDNGDYKRVKIAYEHFSKIPT